jgi:hypothetical protein
MTTVIYLSPSLPNGKAKRIVRELDQAQLMQVAAV